MRITDEEFAARRAVLAQRARTGPSAAVLFDPHHVMYYTGFAFIPTERPIAFVLTADGRGGMLVPRLELEHAEANAAVAEIAHYDEYPGERHPMEAAAASCSTRSASAAGSAPTTRATLDVRVPRPVARRALRRGSR